MKPDKIGLAAAWHCGTYVEEERHGSSSKSEDEIGEEAIGCRRRRRIGKTQGSQAVASWRIWLDQRPAR